METHLSHVTYSYISVLWPRGSWYPRGRAEAVLVTSPRCSKAQRQAEFHALTVISNGPLRLRMACSMDTAQSKPSSHVNWTWVGSASLAQQKPPGGRGYLMELAGSYPLCFPFPQDK